VNAGQEPCFFDGTGIRSISHWHQSRFFFVRV